MSKSRCRNRQIDNYQESGDKIIVCVRNYHEISEIDIRVIYATVHKMSTAEVARPEGSGRLVKRFLEKMYDQGQQQQKRN